jgi:hypothetical protein
MTPAPDVSTLDGSGARAVGLPMRFAPLTFAVLLLPVSALADTAQLDVFVQEAEPLDFVLIRNVEGCGPVTGALIVDFRGSVGQVVIDTAFGGLGTQQFAPVEVLIGPVRPLPVADGAQELVILIAGLAPGDQALVTMDLDSEGEVARLGRIEATAAEMAGSQAVFTAESDGAQVAASLGTEAAASLTVPVDCTPAELS